MPTETSRRAPKTLVAVRMDASMITAIKAEAEARGITDSDIIRQSVAQLLGLDPWVAR